VKEISVQELKQLQDTGASFTLIDVRESNEYDFANIGGELVPMSTLADHIDKFPKEGQVVVHCRSGKRSADVIQYLEQNYGYENLYNLAGGILAWSDEIDPEVPKY
jgi:adenylyltransferase/sulfurtransferase